MGEPTANRNPLAEHLDRVAPGLAGLVAAVTGLGSGGLVSTFAGGSVGAGVGALVGVINAASVLAGLFRSKKGATAQTTPVTSPRDAAGAVLVRADGLPLGSPVGDGPTGTHR